jgi:hypothetical protein
VLKQSGVRADFVPMKIAWFGYACAALLAVAVVGWSAIHHPTHCTHARHHGAAKTCK